MIEKNNKKITKFLNKVKELLDEEIQQGLELVLGNIHLLSIDDSLDYLLNTFCHFFMKLNIVNVEYCDYEEEMQK